jgi:hypothetical protein
MTQAAAMGRCLLPIHSRTIQKAQTRFDQLRRDRSSRDGIKQDRINATEQGTIQKCAMIGGSKHKRVGRTLLKKLRKLKQHAPNLSHILAVTSLRSKGIEFIEELNTPLLG